MNWDEYFLAMLPAVAAKSKDASIKVGCIVVGPSHEIRTTGFNGFPRGCKEKPERNERPAKYVWTEHAERNAIYNAARNGIELEGCTMYLPGFPCADCARAIVQAGIYRLVCSDPADFTKNNDWHFAEAAEILREGAILLCVNAEREQALKKDGDL